MMIQLQFLTLRGGTEILCTVGLNQPYKACRSGLKILRGLLGSLLSHHNRWASSDLSICLYRGWKLRPHDLPQRFVVN